ncbi:calcium-binding protein [Streptococcus gallinaceus]|uniref:Ca2+-binding RTX toxin-like protein n=1 Tax=Streptococcus gallinaceus TaxID=165758 RepID=A0ABV2JN60_9STRE
MKVESKALHASDTKLVIYPDGSMDLASTKSANSRLPEVTVGQLQKYQADPDLVENEAFRKLTAPEQITTERTYKQYTQLLKHIDDMPLDETAKNIYATATGISLDQLSKTDERLIKIGESLTLKKGNAYDKLMEFAKNHERLTNTSNTLLRGMDIGFNVLEAGLVLHDVYKHLHKGDTKGAIGAAIGGSVEWGITNKLGAALTLKLAGLGAVIAGGSVVGLVATTLVAGLIGYGIASYIGSKADELIQQLFASSELVAAPVDPLILDMAGNGFHPTTLGQGAHFDLDQNGFAEKMNWISGDDAMLVIDKNENGIIDDGNEVFGDQTRLKDGQYAKNGFEALREYDSNQDGLISSEDVDFGKLLIWQDNGNAQTEDGELVSLKEAGIQSIQLEYSQFGEESDTGVTFGNTATFTKVDGSQLNIAEYWVKTETHNTIEHNKGSLVGDDAQLPNTASHGALPSLHTAIAMDTSGQLRDMLATFKVTEDAKTRKQQIESILQIIAGATDIADNSRGSRFSAKKLKVVEAFMGRKFIGQNGAEPNANAAKQLETAYQEILQMYYHDLMLQTRVQEVLVMIDQNEKMIRLDQVKEALATVMDESETVQKIGEYAGTLHYLSRYGVKGWEEFRDYYSSQSAIYSKQIALSTNQAIVGDDSGEALTVTAEKSLIYAGAGNDTLNGSNGADTLYGEDGDDTINGGSGNDTIIGGAGDDTLKGGDDKDDHDVYLFGRGHGKDYLYDEYGTSTIRFTDDIVASDFLVRRDGQHIVLMNQVSGDQLTIAYFASHSTHRRVILEFSDGTVHTIDNQDSIFRNLTGTAADETIDLFLSDGGTIRAGAGNDTLNGSNGADTLYGEDGDDTINGGSGNDTIIGGAGDDTLKGGDDKDDHDVYLFGRGHGKDYLYDEYGTSTIRFTDDIVASDFLVRRDGQHIVLMNQVSGDQLTIAYFASHSTHRRVILEFSDGTVHTIDNQDSIFRNLTGTAADETIDLILSDGGTIRAGAGNDTLNGSNGADTLYGEDGDDTINGGSGNDTIIGGAGDDTLKGGDDKDDHDVYLFGRGHGKDYLYDEYGTSTIRFTDDIVASDFLVRRNGQHIVLMNQVSGD